MNEYGFERVASLNEATKELVSRSFQINLLAMDAMVQSKRGGTQLRGFDEVSSQMRTWSRDLHAKLAALREMSQATVALTSVIVKEARVLTLLEATAAASGSASAKQLCEEYRSSHGERSSLLARAWRQITDALFDLDLFGMMAVVLSRSAMIEASGGDLTLRAQLTHVSEEFYRNSEAVVNVLKALINALK